MKLNNHGWGMRQMLFLTSGLLFAMLVAIYFISVLYRNIDGTLGINEYESMEIKLANAAERYVKDNDIIINGEYKISFGTLKSNHYLEDLKDENNRICGGYAIVTETDLEVNAKGYISCDEYVSEGY